MEMIEEIEYIILKLIEDFLTIGHKTEIYLNNNFEFNKQINISINKTINETNFIPNPRDNERTILLSSTSFSTSTLDKLYYGRLCSRKRFAAFLFVLAEVHDLFLSRSHCTYRQLYYRNILIKCNTQQIHCAVNDVCQALNTTSWNLGIFAATKCLIAGCLKVYMSNGDIIDCNAFKGATLMPSNFTYIDKFITSAYLVLLVEKYTVFQNLIANDILSKLNGNVIIMTGRGYPDISTRWILHKLCQENHLPIYALVDGDPFGIEIMLIYRYGSYAYSHYTNELICPQLKWLGIHPSDIGLMMAEREPLALSDYNKIESLLKRSYVDEEICTELLILQMLQCKVKIDNMSNDMFDEFINDYIVNKIKRQIVL